MTGGTENKDPRGRKRGSATGAAEIPKAVERFLAFAATQAPDDAPSIRAARALWARHYAAFAEAERAAKEAKEKEREDQEAAGNARPHPITVAVRASLRRLANEGHPLALRERAQIEGTLARDLQRAVAEHAAEPSSVKLLMTRLHEGLKQ